MSTWVRELNHDGLLRCVVPENGVLSLAISGIINAFWDMWGKIEKKPVWKLLADMSPEKIVSLIDFR
jgi:L-fuconate dehydratase